MLRFSIELGGFEALEMIQVQRRREGIPDALLVGLIGARPFIEAMGRSEAYRHF